MQQILDDLESPALRSLLEVQEREARDEDRLLELQRAKESRAPTMPVKQQNRQVALAVRLALAMPRR